MLKNYMNIGSRNIRKLIDLININIMYSGKYNYIEWECCVIFVIKDDEL